MSRVYDATRRAAEERKDPRAGTLDIPAPEDFSDQSFPTEVVTTPSPAGRSASRSIVPNPMNPVPVSPLDMHIPDGGAAAGAGVTVRPAVNARPSARGAVVEKTPAGATIGDEFSEPSRPVIDEAVPAELRSLVERTLATENVPAAPIERYRALALSLERLEPVGQPRAVVVTSALPGEGKTLTVTNLAYTLSRSYRRRVLILDADLRRPRLHAALSKTGTTMPEHGDEYVSAMKSLGMVLTRLAPTLFLLASPTPHATDPVKTLNSPEMQRVTDWARGRFDWVLIDSPPAGLVPDASILTQLADGVLFVVLAGSTPAPAAKQAIASVGGQRVLGVIMNRVEPNNGDNGAGYYGAYDAYESPVRGSE